MKIRTNFNKQTQIILTPNPKLLRMNFAILHFIEKESLANSS